MPFYSIEAWTYQNTRHAKKICQEKYGGRDVKRFDEWERDRAKLDEVEKPKARTCLGSKHNQELAENAFPHREACASKSLAAAVDTMGACEHLVAALRETWQTWEAH